MKHAFSALALAFPLVLAATGPALAQAPTETVTVGAGAKAKAFKVEVADTKAAAEKGLAGRTALAADQGLLIDYRKVGEPLTPTMKGVAMNLDLLFLAPDGTVVGVIQEARAGSLRPLWTGLRSVATLEIPAGQVAATGVKPGDKVKAKAFGNAG